MRENAAQFCEFNLEYSVRQRESCVIITGSAPDRILTTADRAQEQVDAVAQTAVGLLTHFRESNYTSAAPARECQMPRQAQFSIWRCGLEP